MYQMADRFQENPVKLQAGVNGQCFINLALV